jgi:hypothetical protein
LTRQERRGADIATPFRDRQKSLYFSDFRAPAAIASGELSLDRRTLMMNSIH